MKKTISLGVLSICILFGVILHSYKKPEQKTGLTQDNLSISKNQTGYAMRNFGVSLSYNESTNEPEILEFVVTNESSKEWYWRRAINYNNKNEKDALKTTSDLEVKIEGIWHEVPIKDDIFSDFIQLHLLPDSDTIIPVCTDIYQTFGSGNYRFTIVVYDDNQNEFNLSCEFLIIEEE